MTGTQERALEALYIAAGKTVGVVVDIHTAGLAMHPRTMDALLNRGYIVRIAEASFSVTSAGAAKLAKNRRTSRKETREPPDGSMGEL